MTAAAPGYLPADLTRTPGFQLPSFFTPDAVFDEGYNLFESSFADANARSDTSREATELGESSFTSFSKPSQLSSDALLRSMQQDGTFSSFFGLPTNKISPAIPPTSNHNREQPSQQQQPSILSPTPVTNALDPASVAPSAIWNGFGQERSSYMGHGHPISETSLGPSPPASIASPSMTLASSASLLQQPLRSPLHHLLVDTKCAPVRTQYGQITPPNDSAPHSAEAREDMNMGTDRRTPRQTPAPEFPTQPSVSQKPAQPAKRQRGRPAKGGNVGTPAEPPPPKRQRRTAAAKTEPDQDVSAPAAAEEDQKRNKFLERNRVAASKCRQKKKEWTNNLESRARTLQNERNQLSLMASSLKDEVLWLKGELLKHSTCNCERIRQYLNQEADHLAPPPHQRSSRPSPATILDLGLEDNLFDDRRSHRSSIGGSRVISPVTTTFEPRSRPSTMTPSSPPSERRFSTSSSSRMMMDIDPEEVEEMELTPKYSGEDGEEAILNQEMLS